MTGSERRFTLIELMTVMVILAVIMLAVVPAIDNLVPDYRLKSAARTVASSIELAHSGAIDKRKPHYIEYQLDLKNRYVIIVPKGPEQAPTPTESGDEPEGEPALDPDDPNAGAKKPGDRPENDVEHGKAGKDPNAETPEGGAEEDDDEGEGETEELEVTIMPEDVVFVSVTVDGKEKRTGRVRVPFTRQGDAGGHIVGVKLTQGGETQIWVKFNPLTRTIEYSSEKPEVKTLPGSGGGP